MGHMGTSPVDRHTDTTENITFPQFRWQAIIIILKWVQDIKPVYTLEDHIFCSPYRQVELSVTKNIFLKGPFMVHDCYGNFLSQLLGCITLNVIVNMVRLLQLGRNWHRNEWVLCPFITTVMFYRMNEA